MAKIIRATQKIFASGAANNGIFGSAAAAGGPGTYAQSLSDVQSLPAWAQGWLAATIGAQKFPPLEEFQSLHWLSTTQLAYLFQEGISEYDPATTYYQHSIVKNPGTYQLYGSLTDGNVGIPLNNNAQSAANWVLLCDLSNPANYASNSVANAGTASNAALTPANFGQQQSLYAPGYKMSPGGFIEQWGTTASITPEGYLTVTFPIAFPTGFFGGCATIQRNGADGGGNYSTYIGGATKTSMNVVLDQNDSTSQSFPVYWRAWGN